MSVTDEALLRALCCGGVCVRPGECSVDGKRPRNLLVWVEDALPALRALMENDGSLARALGQVSIEQLEREAETDMREILGISVRALGRGGDEEPASAD